VAITEVVDLEAFEDAISELPGQFFRVKAIVYAVDPRVGRATPSWSAVHRVGLRVSSETIATPDGGGRIVGLGVGVTQQQLSACVAAAVLPSDRGTP
jgi:hypothetical protein